MMMYERCRIMSYTMMMYDDVHTMMMYDDVRTMIIVYELCYMMMCIL